MAGVLRWYQAKLASRPILTQSITTSILFATGDIMAQQAVEGKRIDEHSLERTGRMALYGGCIFGPGATLWYRFLSKKIVIPGRPNLEILARVGTDQTVFASTNLFIFLSSMAMMAGEDPQQALKDKYLTAVKKNWMVWPGVQFVNFKYVPLEHRVLVVNVVSLGWNCYLSYLNSSSGGEHSDSPTYPPDA